MVGSAWLEDLRRRDLVAVKVLMFLIYGGQATLYPYFTLHMQSLGLTIADTAVIFAVQPVVALLGAPLIGLLADRVGNFKLLFSFFLVFSAATANCLRFIPRVAEQSLLGHLDCGPESSDLALSGQPCTNPSWVSFHDCHSMYRIGDSSASRYSNFTFCYEGEKKDPTCLNQSIGESVDVKFKVSWKDKAPDNFSLYKVSIDDIRLNSKLKFKRLTCPFLGIGETLHCNATLSRKYCEEQVGVSETFWLYLGVRLAVTLGIGLVNGLFDAASMTVIQNVNGDVGYQRIWATAGMCIFAPISGALLDDPGAGKESFDPCFTLYATLYCTAAVVSFTMDLSMKPPSRNQLSKLRTLLSNVEVIFLLFHVALLGICWGFLENFLFWFLKNELDSNNLLMGLTVTVGSGTGLMMAFFSTWFTRKLGYINVVVLAFIAYVVRFLGYSYAYNAYVCLIYEMMENLTVTLLTIGVTMYCTELAPLDMLTTMMTLWNGLHVISGRAFGSLLGGFLTYLYGFRTAFRIFAMGSGCFGVLYFILQYVLIQELRKKQEAKSKARPDGEEEELRSRVVSICSAVASLGSGDYFIQFPEVQWTTVTRNRRHSAPSCVPSNQLRRVSPSSRASSDEAPRRHSVIPSVKPSLPTLQESSEENGSYMDLGPKTGRPSLSILSGRPNSNCNNQTSNEGGYFCPDTLRKARELLEPPVLRRHPASNCIHDAIEESGESNEDHRPRAKSLTHVTFGRQPIAKCLQESLEMSGPSKGLPSTTKSISQLGHVKQTAGNAHEAATTMSTEL